MKERVYVGLSGGVDSAVSGALLREKGYNVTGAFIKIWQPEFLECTWREDRLDAMRVAAALAIPFREIDLSDEYQREVIDPMIASYKKGETPNPDIVCNEKIKFDVFARWAHTEGADYVATGHYARVIDGTLYRGVDIQKDQSYFLHRINNEQLSRTLFPIGHLKKSQVRECAEKFRLPNAKRRDSQGLCFVGDITMHEFLARYVDTQDGPVLDMEGKAIGKHHGAVLYTIGARHGFVVDGAYAHEGGRYVIATSVSDNTITVSPNREDAARPSTHLRDMHWIGEGPTSLIVALAQSRYREQPFSVRVERNTVYFDTPHVVSPGQSIVLYEHDRVLGGGVIV